MIVILHDDTHIMLDYNRNCTFGTEMKFWINVLTEKMRKKDVR